MTIEPTNTPIDDSQMFAPVPSWERGKKRRSLGRRVAAEPRSFAPAVGADPILDAQMTETKVERLSDADPANSSFAAPPVYATRARTKSSSAPVAITAGLILIGGIAAAGWYYTQPHGQTGVAELTPGGATTTTTTSDSTTTAAPPSQMAQNAPPPAAVRTTTTTTRTSHDAAPARVRAPRAASDTAADASVRAPVQQAAPPMPLPTPGVAPPPAAATAAPLVLNIPPAATAPQAVTPQAAPQTAPPPTEVPQA